MVNVLVIVESNDLPALPKPTTIESPIQNELKLLAPLNPSDLEAVSAPQTVKSAASTPLETPKQSVETHDEDALMDANHVFLYDNLATYETSAIGFKRATHGPSS